MPIFWILGGLVAAGVLYEGTNLVTATGTTAQQSSQLVNSLTFFTLAGAAVFLIHKTSK